MARGKTNERINIVNRQIMALELRKSGFSYRAIAERCHVTHMQAYRDVQGELKRLDGIGLQSAGELRTMELERLDMAIRGLMPFVEAGSAIHVTALVKVIAERSKLLGLYAPEQVEEKVTVFNELSDSDRSEQIATLLNAAREREARQSVDGQDYIQ